MTEEPDRMAEEELPPSARRVADAARARGLDVAVMEMAESTRTAEDAAAACGCTVAQIVKSLVFRGQTSGAPYLMLVSGANRLSETGVAAHLGEALTRPDAAYVREVTGYAIGGVPPLGHAAPMRVYMDEDLMRFDRVWAAAGTPRAVFAVAPAALAEAAGAALLKVTG
jgi:prolyl-tRNA editing enzyme YbaK/EbsC (Cys-tRNA(Pro) deacylase)